MYCILDVGYLFYFYEYLGFLLGSYSWLESEYVWSINITSFSGSPSLEVIIWNTAGVYMNFRTFLIDQGSFDISCSSKKMSLLVNSSLGHSVMRCMNVSSCSSQSLHVFDIVKSILLWWYAKKFCPVMARVNIDRSALQSCNMCFALFLSGLEIKNFVASCFGVFVHLSVHSLKDS